jgi:succinoglycan biosynthesis protein ExoA
MSGLARQYFNYGKGRARTLKKHGERPKLRQLAPPLAMLGCLLGLLVAPFSLWGLVLPGGYLAVLLLASLSIAAKHRSPCGLLAGPAAAVMHASWSAGLVRQLLS